MKIVKHGTLDELRHVSKGNEVELDFYYVFRTKNETHLYFKKYGKTDFTPRQNYFTYVRERVLCRK